MVDDQANEKAKNHNNENAHLSSKPSTHRATQPRRCLNARSPPLALLLKNSSVFAGKLEEQRLLLQREFRELEGQAKEAEKEAHAHSRQSAIGPDGMIIPARARKKRRLDEELEGLLEAMEVAHTVDQLWW